MSDLALTPVSLTEARRFVIELLVDAARPHATMRLVTLTCPTCEGAGEVEHDGCAHIASCECDSVMVYCPDCYPNMGKLQVLWPTMACGCGCHTDVLDDDGGLIHKGDGLHGCMHGRDEARRKGSTMFLPEHDDHPCPDCTDGRVLDLRVLQGLMLAAVKYDVEVQFTDRILALFSEGADDE